MQLNGQALTLPEIAAVALGDVAVEVSPSARPRLLASRKVIEDIIARDAVVYGVTTGFGKLSDVRVPHDELRELQLNLVRSHACGIGPPLSEAEVRAMMLLRANVLALGLSGIRPGIIEMLCDVLLQAGSRLGKLRIRLVLVTLKTGNQAFAKTARDEVSEVFVNWKFLALKRLKSLFGDRPIAATNRELKTCTNSVGVCCRVG